MRVNIADLRHRQMVGHGTAIALCRAAKRQDLAEMYLCALQSFIALGGILWRA